MGAIVDAVFGGSAKDASREQTKATRQAMQEYKKGVAEAKREITPRFEEATEKRLERTQQAMDVLGSGFAPSLNALSQGNMSAQQMLAGSMPQMQNAILGGPVDYSAFQPQGIDFDPQSFLAGMPQVFNPSDQGAGAQVPQQPNVPSNFQQPSGPSNYNPVDMSDPRNTYTNPFGQIPPQIGDPVTPASSFGTPFNASSGLGGFGGGAIGGGGMPSFQNWEKLR